MGFQLKAEGHLLAEFARWAAERGEPHVRTQSAMEWAAAAGTPWQREKRLRAVATFARHARAENSQHDVPPICVFGRRHVRPVPHIYSPDELRRLFAAASQLPASWPLRPQVFTTLLSLLAVTGMRISEALALRFDDVTVDGLVIRKAKFNKSRIVPLHLTTTSALGRYLDLRRRAGAVSDFVFISPKGDQLPYATVSQTFLKLVRAAGLRSARGTPGPRIHDLRHTFAVRALEACPAGGSPVGGQVRALSTYLGHRNIADTCWYLHVTPELMRGVADACERLLEGGAP